MRPGFVNLPLLLFGLISLALLQFSSGLTAAQSGRAPSWEGTEWINLPPGKKSLDVKDLKGRVVYLSFFQKW